MKWIKLLYAIILSLLLFSGCTCIYSVLDYVDENNKSYIELFNEDGCKVSIKYIGTYPSYPDIHGHSVTKEMISYEQTYIEIKGPNSNKNEPISKIIDCHVELRGENNTIFPFKSIIVKPDVVPSESVISFNNEKKYVDSKPSLSNSPLFYYIMYLYEDTSDLKTVNFHIKLTLSIKGKIHIIEKSALLKRKEGKVFFTPFFKIKI